MKNIKNSLNKRNKRSLCRSIAEEELTFKNGMPLGTLSMETEDGETKRKVRRIVEKRVCSKYWKNRKCCENCGNKYRAATKRYVSKVSGSIFGILRGGFSCAMA